MKDSKNKIAIYPGCSLESTAMAFQTSLETVLDTLEIEYGVLKDWNCCGATSAHAIDHELYLGLNLRNLAIAEQKGYDRVIAPCAACYHRMASAANQLKQNENLLRKLNEKTNLNYQGTVTVVNVMDFLANTVGKYKIAEKVTNPLSGMKVACYYGCLNTRLPRSEPFDVVEYPLSMDNITTAIGAQTLDWPYKTECCGASLFISSEKTAAKLIAKILKDAIAHDADYIAVSCPLCFNNLDTKQKTFKKQFGLKKLVPIVYITQLMGLAYGLDASKLKLGHGYVPFAAAEWGSKE